MKIKMLTNKLEYKPVQANEHAIGIDVYAVSVEYNSEHSVYVVGTGIAIQPNEGMWTEIVPRSSLYKKGFMLANSVGIIDPDYRGEVKMMLVRTPAAYESDIVGTQFGARKISVHTELLIGQRVGQLIMRPILQSPISFVSELTETERGAGGFGSTGER